MAYNDSTLPAARCVAWKRFVTGALCTAFFLAVSGCAEDQKASPTAEVENSEPKSADVLVFPSELRVKDDSVNSFLSQAMKTCGDGLYEPFRLLWSAKEDTLSRADFEEGWQAVEEIRIHTLQPVFLPAGDGSDGATGETVYVAIADVNLDPTHRAGEREPHREVALMIVREKGAWRLARAPAKMRSWVEKLSQKTSNADRKAPPLRVTTDQGSGAPQSP